MVRQTAPFFPPSLVTKPFEIPPGAFPRTDLADELLRRVHHFRIIPVIAPPASGKTHLMRLVANRLLEQGSTVHIITDWPQDGVQGGWERYLMNQTGYNGNAWLRYNAYLLLDQARNAYWDRYFTRDFLAQIDHNALSCVVLFASCGLEPSHGDLDNMRPFPLNGEVIGLHRDNPPAPWASAGLLLRRHEADDFITSYHSARSAPAPTYEMKEVFHQCTNGYVGIIVALLDILFHRKGFDYMQNTPFDWTSAAQSLFADLPALFRSIHDDAGIRNAMGLPNSNEIVTVSELMDLAVAYNGLWLAKLGPDSKRILCLAWSHGWLLPQKSALGVHFGFASPMHRWYFYHLLHPMWDSGLEGLRHMVSDAFVRGIFTAHITWTPGS